MYILFPKKKIHSQVRRTSKNRKAQKHDFADCRIWRRVYRKSTETRGTGDSYGVEPRKWERSFEIKTFRKEGEEIHPSGNEHIPPIGNF